MESSRVGIGLTVYNNAKHLAKTLNSILGQSYGNFIVYLSDDHSTDGTGNICEAYARKDHRVQYTRNSFNIGQLKNCQKVLEQAETEYFMFARGDEILPRNLLEDGINILQNDTNAALAFSTTRWIDEADHIIVDKHLNYFDTRGCDVVTRCVLAIWGKYEYWYGLTKTSTMRRIRFAEEIIATDLIMVLEMALVGSFAHINSGVRCRRYRYSGETYKKRIKRYQQTLYSESPPLIDQLFPFARFPYHLIRSIWSSRHSSAKKMIISLAVLINAPIKYVVSRGKEL